MTYVINTAVRLSQLNFIASYIGIATLSIICNIFILLIKRKNCLLASVQFLGAILYFYGGFVIDPYSEELKCDPSCLEIVRVSGTVSLGLALMLYYLFMPSTRMETIRPAFKIVTHVDIINFIQH